jgi:hypothetical protein
MAELKAVLNITGMDVFNELLAIVRAVVDDPDVPQKHKDWVHDWAQSHDTDYDFDKPVEIMASHAICPLCGMGKRYEQR